MEKSSKFVGLRAKTYSYLIYHGSKEDLKIWLKFENYKNSLEATQLENRIKYLAKNKINREGLKKNHEKINI